MNAVHLPVLSNAKGYSKWPTAEHCFWMNRRNIVECPSQSASRIRRNAISRVGGRESITSTCALLWQRTWSSKPQSLRNGSVKTHYRLNVYPIFLPPMRERPEDIPLLIRHFLEAISAEYKLDVPVVASDALEHIMRYSWPGNVRQLRAMCERWVITRGGQRWNGNISSGVRWNDGRCAAPGSHSHR